MCTYTYTYDYVNSQNTADLVKLMTLAQFYGIRMFITVPKKSPPPVTAHSQTNLALFTDISSAIPHLTSLSHLRLGFPST
jgi:hypothetical protein